jgi:hypothetical protein
MKKETGKATATVKDYSLLDAANENGGRNDGTKEVEVDYTFEYDILESKEELDAEFSAKDLLELANARKKSTANSGARQKAIAPFAQDPNSQDAIRERMIKDAMKIKSKVTGENKTRDEAEAFVDSLLNA